MLKEMYQDKVEECPYLRLEKELLEQKLKNKMLYETAKEAKSEAIKEFAERLQTYIRSMMGHMHSGYVVRIQKKIDNLVQEMVGD